MNQKGDCCFSGCRIGRVVVINAAMLVYFIIPNLTSFLMTTLLVLLLVCDKPFSDLSRCLAATPNLLKSASEHHENFAKNNLIQQLLAIVLFGLTCKVSFFLPNWLVIAFVCELIAFWPLLQSLGICSKICLWQEKGQQAVVKLVDLIPRYQE